MDIQINAGDNPDMKRYQSMVLQAGAHHNYAEINLTFGMQFKREKKYNGSVVTSSVAAAAKDWEVAPQKHVHVSDMLPGENLAHGLSIGLTVAKNLKAGFSMKQDNVCVRVKPQDVDYVQKNPQVRENIINKMWEFLDGTCTKTYVPNSEKYKVGYGLV